jgi:xanthine dehydrogenase/oxidase
MSTDMYGMATLDACRQILKRLQPIREKLGPDAPLKDVAKTAFMERIDLSAHGFFTLHNDRCGFDWTLPKPDDFPVDKKPWNSWKGHPFNYFTQGVACSEVEVDLLSGNHRIIRSDILMDVVRCRFRCIVELYITSLPDFSPFSPLLSLGIFD